MIATSSIGGVDGILLTAMAVDGEEEGAECPAFP